uniref:RNase H type-1 domain-containing protein n=1 Tax=Oryza meridionalis TaxID=40149 RepID=A0A0E0D7J9_9ORYZ
MTRYQWECLLARILKKRIIIADDWENSYGKIKILFHEFIMEDSDDGKPIFMGVCDGQFIQLFKADGTPEEFGLATLAYILWKRNILIAARVLKGVLCPNNNVAESLACSALMQDCLLREDVDHLSILTDSGAVHRAISGEPVSEHGPNSDEYALLKFLASKFKTCTSTQQPREVIFPVDQLIREMEESGRILNYAHKAQEKSYIHVDENFKLQAYIHITNDLFPLKVVLVFDSFEKKPLLFQNEVNKLLPRGTVKLVEGECTTFTICRVSNSDAKVDESNLDTRTMVFVFDASLPVDSYKQDESCVIILVSEPHELRLMAQWGIPEMNTSTFLRFHGVEKETRNERKKRKKEARKERKQRTGRGRR